MDDADGVVAHVTSTIGSEIEPHPGGWPGQAEVALIDAIFSARSNYGVAASDDRPATGVYRVLDHWYRLRGDDTLDDLQTLVDTVDDVGIASLLAVNAQRVPGRQDEPMSKWEAVRNVAVNLVSAGYRSSEEVLAASWAGKASQLKTAFVDGTPGVGGVTFDYFLVLLGSPGVKADTMIRAFVDEALNPGSPLGSGEERRVSPATASDLVRAAAEKLGASPSALDHAIWLHQRAARSRRAEMQD